MVHTAQIINQRHETLIRKNNENHKGRKMSVNTASYDPYFVILRVAIELVSVVICLILVKFMIKPYQVTREGRYIGLPLGFSFLGISYAISAITYSGFANYNEIIWRFQLILRAFSFVFLAVAYYFSKKPTKNTHYIWKIVFSGLLIILATSVLLSVITPYTPRNNYLDFSVRIVSFICIAYIFIHCLREKTIAQDPYAKWVLVAYALLGLSQYSIIVWIADFSYFAFWGSLIFRLTSLVVLLAVTYKIFGRPKKGS